MRPAAFSCIYSVSEVLLGVFRRFRYAVFYHKAFQGRQDFYFIYITANGV